MIKKPITMQMPTQKDPNHFPLSGTALAVRLLADRVSWLSVVDEIIPWDQARSRIAPSVQLLMLAITVLSQRNPLYTVEAWAETLPLALLWGPTVQATQFNDDALGRLLEDLADYGPQLLATWGARMQVVHPTLKNLLHADTTAYSLMGDYPSSVTGGVCAPALRTLTGTSVVLGVQVLTCDRGHAHEDAGASTDFRLNAISIPMIQKLGLIDCVSQTLAPDTR